MKLAVLGVVALTACAQDSVTAVEVHTEIPTDRGITQLRISGDVDGVAAFAPGMLPEVPRALDASETAVILLPDTQGGRQLALSVDAMAGDTVAMSATNSVVIERGGTEVVDIVFDGAGSGSGSDGGMDPGDPTVAFTAFGFTAAANAKLASDVTAAVLGSTITAALPSTADEKNLIASFTTAEANTVVTIASATQTSGVTLNTYAGTVTYRLRTPEGATRDYLTAIKRSTNDKPGMLAFGFAKRDNPQLAEDAIGTVSGSTVTVHVPPGTNTHALVASFAVLGTATINSVAQTSAQTPNDFGTSLPYVVTTSKGTTTFTASVLAN